MDLKAGHTAETDLVTDTVFIAMKLIHFLARTLNGALPGLLAWRFLIS